MPHGCQTSRPPPLLAFDCPGGEQLDYNGSTGPLNPSVTQVFLCRHDQLHRFEVFLEGRAQHRQLWFRLFEGSARSGPALRTVGPLAAERLQGGGWFAFEFTPVESSAGRTFVAVIESPDGFVGPAVGLRVLRGAGAGLTIGRASVSGALLYRASCVRHPAQAANFELFREAWRTRGPVARHLPLMARLEISRVCDLECIMCPLSSANYRAALKGPGFLSLKTLRQLDPVLPTLLRVMAFGLGEPFLNPDFMAILRHIRGLNPTAQISASTNATHLDAAKIRAIIAEELVTDLQVSIDGARRETFEAVRVHASHAATLRALDQVLAARARHHDPCAFIVKTEMMVMRRTAGEVLDYVRQMARRGVDHIVLDSPKGPLVGDLVITDPDQMLRVYEQVREAHDLLRGRRTVLSGPLMEELRCWHIRSGRPGPAPDWGEDPLAELSGVVPASVLPCSVPWESCSLAASGLARVCCNSYRPLGSALDGDFVALWQQGDSYRQLRGELTGRKPHGDCQSCLAQNTVAPDQITPATYLQSSWREQAELHHAPAVILSAAGDFSAGGLRFDIDPSPAPGRLSGWISGPALPQGEISLAVFQGATFAGFAPVLRVGEGLGKWSTVADATMPAGRELSVFLHRDGAWSRIPPGLGSTRRTSLLAACATLATGPLGRTPLSSYQFLSGLVEAAEVAGDFLLFTGWARDVPSNQPACGLILSVDGRPWQSTHPWISRPDLARHFAATDPHFGFSLELPRSVMMKTPAPQIEILAVDESGRRLALPWRKPADVFLRTVVPPPHPHRRPAEKYVVL